MEDMRLIVVMTFCCLITLDPVSLQMTSSSFPEESNNVSIKVSNNGTSNTKGQTAQSSTHTTLTKVPTKEPKLIAGAQETGTTTKLSPTSPVNTKNTFQVKESTYFSILSKIYSNPTVKTIQPTNATTGAEQVTLSSMALSKLSTKPKIIVTDASNMTNEAITKHIILTSLSNHNDSGTSSLSVQVTKIRTITPVPSSTVISNMSTSAHPSSTVKTTGSKSSDLTHGRTTNQSTGTTQLHTEVVTPPPTATGEPRKSTSKQSTRTTATTKFGVYLTTGGVFQTTYSSPKPKTTLSESKTLTTPNKTKVQAANSQISSSKGTSRGKQPTETVNTTDNFFNAITSTMSSSKKEIYSSTTWTTATKNALSHKNITADTTTQEFTRTILLSKTTPTSKPTIPSITPSVKWSYTLTPSVTSTKTPTTIQTFATGLSMATNGSMKHATTKETEKAPLTTIPSTLSGSSTSVSNTTLTSQSNVISTNTPDVSTEGTETTALSNQTNIFGRSTIDTTHRGTGKSNITTQESGKTSVSVDTTQSTETTKVPTTSKLQSTSTEPPQSLTTSLSLDISTLQSASGTEKQQSSQQTTIKIKSSNEITISPPSSTTYIENGLNNSSNGITTHEPSPTITSMERSNLTSTNDIPTQPPLTTISMEKSNPTSASEITTQALLSTTFVDTNILNRTSEITTHYSLSKTNILNSTIQPLLQTTPVDNLNSTSEITMQSSPTTTSVETRNINFTSGITKQSSPQTTSMEIQNLNSTKGITTQSSSSKTSVEKYNLNSISGITTHLPPPTTSVITTNHTSVSGITKQSLPPTTSVETSTFKPANLSTEQPSSSTIKSVKTSHHKSTYGITTLPPLSTSQPPSSETTLFTTSTQQLKTVTKERTLTPTVKSTTHPSTTQLLSTETPYIKTSKVSSTNELTTQPPTISMKTNKYNSTYVTTKQSPSSASTVITTSKTKAVKLSTTATTTTETKNATNQSIQITKPFSSPSHNPINGKSTTTVGPCKNPFSVIQGGCRKPCDEDDVSCGSSGKCYIDDDKLTICVCNTDDGLFQHSGDKCDVREMKSKYVITIAAGGAGGIILIVLFIVCGCWCWRRTRNTSYASEWDSLHDYRVSGRNVQYIDGYKTDGTFGKGKDNPAYDKYYREGDFTENDKKDIVISPENIVNRDEMSRKDPHTHENSSFLYSDVWKPRSLRLKPDTN